MYRGAVHAPSTLCHRAPRCTTATVTCIPCYIPQRRLDDLFASHRRPILVPTTHGSIFSHLPNGTNQPPSTVHRHRSFDPHFEPDGSSFLTGHRSDSPFKRFLWNPGCDEWELQPRSVHRRAVVPRTRATSKPRASPRSLRASGEESDRTCCCRFEAALERGKNAGKAEENDREVAVPHAWEDW